MADTNGNLLGYSVDLIPTYALRCDMQSEDRSVGYAVLKKPERSVGELALTYLPEPDLKMSEVGVTKLDIDERHRNQGLGRAIVRAIPELPIPAGEWLKSDSISIEFILDLARGQIEKSFWEQLEREKLLRASGRHRYQVLK
jgi:GNAT superfamily N-acetyltransferase